MAHPIKFYNHKFHGAPTLALGTDYTTDASQFFKAILVTGFGEIEVDSVVFDSTENAAKATYAAGHSYQLHQIITVAGASLDEYNGEHRVLKVSPTEIWFSLDTPQTATPSGTITIKTSPLGWSIFAANDDESKVIYQVRNGEEGNVMLLIDNSNIPDLVKGTSQGLWLDVRMVENVVDIDTYDILNIETDANRNRWTASHAYSGGKNPSTRPEYALVGSDKLFWFFPAHAAQYNYTEGWLYRDACIAGYINSYKTGDRYHFILSGFASPPAGVNTHSYEIRNSAIGWTCNTSNLKMQISKSFDQQNTAIRVDFMNLPYPFSGMGDSSSPVDHAWRLTPMQLEVGENENGRLGANSDGGSSRAPIRGNIKGAINPFSFRNDMIDKFITTDGLLYFTNGATSAVHSDNSKTTLRQGLIGFDISDNGWD